MRYLALISIALVAPAVHAQGSTFMGRVLTDSGVAIAGAEVVLTPPPMTQRTNGRGEFRFVELTAGEYIVSVRMPGFAPKADTIELADAGDVRREYRLSRIETLPEVPVTASLLDRKLVEFYERRRMGIGRFLDSAEFANARGTRTSDRLKKLPGLMIGRGRFLSEAYVLSTRTGEGKAAGSNAQCRAAIWLDGVNLWTDYSVNQLDPSAIAAVEWYAGPASVPAKFNITPSTPQKKYCGVLLIWLR